MSLDILRHLCENAVPHLPGLPDIREHMLNCSFKTEWNPEEELQHELDAVVTEMRASLHSDAALVLYCLLKNDNLLKKIRTRLFDSKQRQLANMFFFKYPLLVWVLLSQAYHRDLSFAGGRRERTAAFWAHSDFIYYVASELPYDSFWKPTAFSFTSNSSHLYITPCISKACARYLMWDKAVYVYGETPDQLHIQVSEALFNRELVPQFSDAPEDIDVRLLAVLIQDMDNWNDLSTSLDRSKAICLLHTRMYLSDPPKADTLVLDSRAMAGAAQMLSSEQFAYLFALYLEAEPPQTNKTSRRSGRLMKKSRQGTRGSVAGSYICDRILDVAKILSEVQERIYITEVFEQIQWAKIHMVDARKVAALVFEVQECPQQLKHAGALADSSNLGYIVHKAVQHASICTGARCHVVWQLIALLEEQEIKNLFTDSAYAEKLDVIVSSAAQTFLQLSDMKAAISQGLTLEQMCWCVWGTKKMFGKSVLGWRKVSDTLLTILERSTFLARIVYIRCDRKDFLKMAVHRRLFTSGAISQEELVKYALENPFLLRNLLEVDWINFSNLDVDPIALISTTIALRSADTEASDD